MIRIGLMFLIILPALCLAEDDSTKWKLTFEERFHTPDSIYDEDKGIFMDRVINKWRKSHGLEPIQVWKTGQPTVKSPQKQSIPFRTGFNNSQPESKWRFIEQAFDQIVTDTDSVEIFIKRNGRLCEMNSRWYLTNGKDTLYSFIAVRSWYPLYPIRDAYVQNENVIFMFQKYESEVHPDIYSVHGVVNGENLSETGGFQNTLIPTFIGNQLFYLFEKDGKWGYSFDGEDHPNLWDEIHRYYHDGGGSALVDAPSYGSFSALRDGNWYHVVGKLEPAE